MFDGANDMLYKSIIRLFKFTLIEKGTTNPTETFPGIGYAACTQDGMRGGDTITRRLNTFKDGAIGQHIIYTLLACEDAGSLTPKDVVTN